MYRLVVTIPGNAIIKLGDIVELPMPSAEMITSSRVNKLDGHLSGKYLVSSIRHKITRSDHTMTMDLIKDSFKDSLLIGKRPTNEPTKTTGTFF